MSYGGFDYDEEELNEINKIHQKHNWRKKVSDTEVRLSLKAVPVFCYDLIDLGETDYHFTQSCFDNKDIKAYFTQIQKISRSTIFQLTDERDRGLHLYRSEINKKLRVALQKLSGKKEIDDFTVYHFALYTSKEEKADRKTGVKSPRIYFLVGANSMLYVLFYDPYHEMNPIVME
jgi:hypothetical protein